MEPSSKDTVLYSFIPVSTGTVQSLKKRRR